MSIALQEVAYGEQPASSDKINRLVRALNGTDSTPIVLNVQDDGSYALTVLQSGAGAKGAIIYDSDGVTVLLDVRHQTVALYKPTVADFTNAQHTHVGASQGGALGAPGLTAPQVIGYALQSNY